jgi:hypothetical protein
MAQLAALRLAARPNVLKKIHLPHPRHADCVSNGDDLAQRKLWGLDSKPRTSPHQRLRDEVLRIKHATVRLSACFASARRHDDTPVLN